MAKYSPSGSVVWAARISGTSGENRPKVSADRFGKIYISGHYSSALLTLYDASGNAVKTLLNPGGTSYSDIFVARYIA